MSEKTKDDLALVIFDQLCDKPHFEIYWNFLLQNDVQ